MPIPVEEVQKVKQASDIVSVIEAHGVKLTRKGKDLIGLCPFHEETAPSFTVNPRDQLYHCFGCPPDGKTGGDVISFITRLKGIGFKEALAYLGGNGVSRSKGNAQSAAHRTPEQRKLLERVVRFYQASFQQDSRGREYLKSRGITDVEALTTFGAGFVSGTLLDASPRDEELIQAFQALGILNARRHELFFGSVVFPLTDPVSGAPVGLYGRRIEDGEVSHLYLPGPRRGLVNWQAAKRSKSVILTESVIDALSLYANGFRNVIPLYGTQGWTADHEALLAREAVQEAYLVFDADDPGRKAADVLQAKLTVKGIDVHVVDLPEKDVNVFFLRHSPEQFEALLREANPRSVEHSDRVRKRDETAFEATPHGFKITFGGRYYEAKGISRTETQLRVTLKAVKQERDQEGKLPRFELTTLDLYSARSRDWHSKVLSRLFGEPEALVREDLMRLVEKAETFETEAQKQKAEPAKPAITPEDKEEALAFLQRPDLEKSILEDLEAVGLCGEETNKLLGYLVATSRKLDEPLSMVVQSRSAAGKSALQDAILSLIPPEDVCKYTRITDQALFYREGSPLKHKVLALEEAEGMGGAVYSIRALQSAGEIRILSTSKNAAGALESRENKVEGPVSFLMTTTRSSIEVDGELASRNLFTTIDESRERTEEILKKQRARWTLEGLKTSTLKHSIQKRHWNAQRLLEPLKVVNRFADQLRFPSWSLRARRDQEKYLGIVAAIAFLKQKQRSTRVTKIAGQEVHYIEATREDIDMANELAREVLGRSLDELSPPSRKLLDEIRQMVVKRSSELGIAPDEYAFTRREVRQWTGWSDFQVKLHIEELTELEYLFARQGKKGKEYVYELKYGGEGQDGRKFLLGLTPASELKDPPEIPEELAAKGGNGKAG